MPENQKNEKKQQNKKSRNWTFLVYPDSAPEEWEDYLQGLRYCHCRHNLDVFKDTGKIKKDHIHVIISFDGPTTFNAVKELTDSLNSPFPQPVRSLRGAIRYLIHADNKDKYQYKREDIVSVGMDQEIKEAFSVKKSDEQKKVERVSCYKQIKDIIKNQKLTSWEQLDDALDDLDDVDLLDYVGNHAFLIDRHLNENWHRYVDNYSRK